MENLGRLISKTKNAQIRAKIPFVLLMRSEYWTTNMRGKTFRHIIIKRFMCETASEIHFLLQKKRNEI